MQITYLLKFESRLKKKTKKRNEKHIEKPNKFPFYDNDLRIRSTRTSGKRKCD